jgi:hypothetical protein
VVLVARPQPTDESFPHRPRPEDEQVVVPGQLLGDAGDEPVQVLQAARLARRLRSTASPVADRRIVTDVSGGAVMGRHIRGQPDDPSPTAPLTDDDGFAGVDPDQRESAGLGAVRRQIGSRRPGHACAQAGASPSTARSA